MIGKKFIAKQLSKHTKATVQKSGKLGFNRDAMEELALSTKKFISIAPDDEISNVFYMCITDTQDDYTFPVQKSGEYMYLATKQLFEKAKIDFRKTYIFDLERFEEGDEVMGGVCYKMNGRPTGRQNKINTNEKNNTPVE